jgi:DNA repair protein RecN (Recombination protein N)
VIFSAASGSIMLKLLKINNIALIQAVEIELGPGLTLLTGETGAGKSILIDALGLILGERASSELIRTGEEQAIVEALIEGPGLASALESRGLPVEGDEAIIRREIFSSGKGRATVNGALVPLTVLRELAPEIATLHGQHDPQGLLDPATHLPLLDRHAGLEAEAAALREPFRRLRAIESALAAIRGDQKEIARRRELLLFEASEIEQAGLAPGEEEALRHEKTLQANAGRLLALAEEAYALLYEDEGAVLSRLGSAYRKVEDLSQIDPRFRPYVEGRGAIVAQLEDLALFLRDYREGLSVTPGRLDAIESRLAIIERLKRKYGGSVEEVLATAARCRAELEAFGSPEDQERTLEREKVSVATLYRNRAEALSRKRRSAARDLETRVQKELALLAMEKTRFEVSFTAPGDPSTWSETGLETAAFLLSPNPGEELRPLARIASGGELSRILLALKSVATLDAAGKTLVFDEVDAGIGGRAAEVVGRKLKSMTRNHQVLCVTHLPQIASLADTHLAVRKRVERSRTLTEVKRLSAEERVDEIARMLGGETITEAARRHAREMVKSSL